MPLADEDANSKVVKFIVDVEVVLLRISLETADSLELLFIMHVVVVDELVLAKTQGLQVRCALGNDFNIITPSSNAPQDFASWPHKADTIIVKIVSLIDSREKNG